MVKTLEERLLKSNLIDVMGGPITSIKEIERDLYNAHLKQCETIVLVAKHLAGNKYYAQLYIPKKDFRSKY